MIDKLRAGQEERLTGLKDRRKYLRARIDDLRQARVELGNLQRKYRVELYAVREAIARTTPPAEGKERANKDA